MQLLVSHLMEAHPGTGGAEWMQLTLGAYAYTRVEGLMYTGGAHLGTGTRRVEGLMYRGGGSPWAWCSAT